MIVNKEAYASKKIFNHELRESNHLAEKVASSWYQFSKFVPSFLSELAENITEPLIKERISIIIDEELGAGKEEERHSLLFKDSMKQIGILINEIHIESINVFHNKFKKSLDETTDKEAFCVGVSYGLEIIAEENIAYLLQFSCPKKSTYESLKETIFFSIHLINEKDHIEKCVDNYNLVIQSGIDREKSFNNGRDLSLKFWKNFWNEATI